MEPANKPSGSSILNVGKRAELNKLMKKVEKASRKWFHAERNPTFVPSSQNNAVAPEPQAASQQVPSVPPPYPPNHHGFGQGFGFPNMPHQVVHQPVPPSYGWALNGIPTSAPSSSAFTPLSLNIGAGDETAGSGYNDLPINELNLNDPNDYLVPDDMKLGQLISEQHAKMEDVKVKVMIEQDNLCALLQDLETLDAFLASESNLVDKEISVLEEEVADLENALKIIRKRNPGSMPPPRPPPPRSISQDITANGWKCARCKAENGLNVYKCAACQLPGWRIDPNERKTCDCPHCLP